MATANGERLISCEIKMPRIGAWEATFEVDLSAENTEEAFAADDLGRVGVTLEHAGASFVGTVLRSGVQGDKLTGKLVGGRGGLTKELSSKNYQTPLGVKVDTLLGDILRESGEVLSETVEQAVRDRKLQRWSRASGTAKEALTRLATALDLSWRVLRDGTVWLGTDAYPTIAPDHIVVDEDDNRSGTQALASLSEDASGPLTIDPGVTFNGRKVQQVIHRLDRRRFRTEVAERTARDALKAASAGAQTEIDYSREYFAKVTAMNPDGTVQVVPDDPKIAGSGLDAVRIWLGVPGTVTVPSGARCVLKFAGGNPQDPFVSAFGSGALTELRLGGGAQFVALANLCDSRFNAIESKINSMVTAINSHIHTGVTTGGGSSGPPAAPQGALSSGSSVAASKVKAD
jgi:hypothetical protein